MSTKITETDMSSDVTRHTATRTEAGWVVTWLPGRALTQSQAITAMTIAETIAAHDVIGDPLHAGHRLWPHIDQWAAELGISGPRAVALATMPPEDCGQVDGGQGATIAEAPRTNRYGSECPVWCDTDHAKVIGGRTTDTHVSAAMGDAIEYPRVVLAKYSAAGVDGNADIQVEGTKGYASVIPEFAVNMATLIESLADCTPDRIRALADEVRYAASILAGGAQ